MGKQFDFDRPAFRPMVSNTNTSVVPAKSKTLNVNNKQQSTALRKRDSSNTAVTTTNTTTTTTTKAGQRYTNKRSHEQRNKKGSLPLNSDRSQGKSRGSRNKARDQESQSTYDYLERGVQAPDKPTHINALYQFVLDACYSDTASLLNNPDAIVPMDHVLSVICQPMSCPICLEDVPEAPRMLECGHVMCLPCLLRYLDSPVYTEDHSDVNINKKLKKCPLCTDTIRLNKVKPVLFKHIVDELDTPKEDHDVVLRLMFRPLGSLLAVPVTEVPDVDTDYFSKDFIQMDNTDKWQFSRILRGSADYSIAQRVKEIRELMESKQNAVAIYQGQSEDVMHWYDEAVKYIKSSEIQHLKELNISEREYQMSVLSIGNDENHQYHDDDQHENQENYKHKTHKSIDLSRYQNGEAFYFYQTAFGLPTKYFLAPLDIKILKAAYEDFHKLPPFIIAQVTNAESGWYVNDDLIKRVKYLGHIPKHTPVVFLECDWTDIVDSTVLKQFSQELNARKRRKEAKKHKETRDKLRYEKLAETKLRKDTGFEMPYVINKPDEPVDITNPAFTPALPGLPIGTPAELRAGKTVWGTQAVAFSAEKQQQEEELPETGTDLDVDYDQLINDAKQLPKGKGRKKLVLLSTRSGR